MKYLTLFTFLLVIHISPINARPVSSIRVPLTVCLTNEAGVDWKTVAAVETRVSAMFKESAVEIHWINYGAPMSDSSGPGSCGRIGYPRRLLVHWLPRARTAPSEVLGEAFLDEQGSGVIADLFLDHAQAVDSEAKVGLANLLAYATAHELGHLLLGAHSHSSMGIMQGYFHGQDLGGIRRGSLSFDRDQEERMHSRLMGDPLPVLMVNGR